MSEYFGSSPLWIWVKNDDGCDPFSAGTLTHVKMIEACVESALPPYACNLQQRVAFFCFDEDG
jgi:hypothetical protein